MLDKPASPCACATGCSSPKRLMEETGCYDGITELTLRNAGSR